MTHTTESMFSKNNIERFSGRKFIHVAEVADAIGITTKGIIQYSLTAKFPLYVMLERGWKLGVADPDSGIVHSKNYTLLKLGAVDVATLFTSDMVEVSDFYNDDDFHVRVLSTTNKNGIFIPENTVKITVDKLIIMYSDLKTLSTPNPLGETEKENLLKSVAALAYTAVHFYNKASKDKLLGEKQEIKVSPLVDEVLLTLSGLGLSTVGIGDKSLQGRISAGIKLIKKS